MKKLLLAALICCSAQIFAWDIIVTTDNQSLTVRITEISDTEIRYKPSDNPDGPNYVIRKDKVNTILYENGKVEQFTASTPQEEQPAQNQPVQEAYRPSPTVNVTNGKRITNVTSNSFMVDGQTLTGQDCRKYLEDNCTAAYQELLAQEKLGKGLVITGVCFFVPGVILGSLGASMYVDGVKDLAKAKDNSHRKSAQKDITTGSALMGVGWSMFGVSIPLLVVGYVKTYHAFENAVEVYDVQCDQRRAANDLRFNLQMGSDGLGVAMNF